MMIIYRISRWLRLRGIPLLPWLLKGVNRILFNVVLPPAARLGKDVLLYFAFRRKA